MARPLATSVVVVNATRSPSNMRTRSVVTWRANVTIAPQFRARHQPRSTESPQMRVMASVATAGHLRHVPLTAIVFKMNSFDVASRNRFPLTKICADRNGAVTIAGYDNGVTSSETNAES